MGDPEIIVLDRGDADTELSKAAYHAVLRPSFTEDELPGVEQFLKDTAGQSIVVLRRSGEVCAAAVTDHLVSAPVALLSHLAVRPDQRGLGTGSQLFLRLVELWASGLAEVVLGEVHDPRFWPSGEDERPADRLAFYERHGARVLTVPWTQPVLQPLGQRVSGMLLLTLGGRGPHSRTEVVRSTEAVPSKWIRDWMTRYYVDTEGPASVTDPTVVELLARADQVDPVPTLAISDYRDVLPLFD